MSRLRVLDIAKELKLDTKTVIAKLNDLGIQVKNHFNAISDIEADKLRAYLRSGRNPEKEAAAKPASKVVIRRRTDAVPGAEAFGTETQPGTEETVATFAAPLVEKPEELPAPETFKPEIAAQMESPKESAPHAREAVSDASAAEPKSSEPAPSSQSEEKYQRHQ